MQGLTYIEKSQIRRQSYLYPCIENVFDKLFQYKLSISSTLYCDAAFSVITKLLNFDLSKNEQKSRKNS